jgi:nitrite reductase (NADH) large subunit
MLSLYVKGNKVLPEQPQSLIVKGCAGAGMTIDSLEDGGYHLFLQQRHLRHHPRCHRRKRAAHRRPEIQKCTKAGTGCGGCLPMVKAVLKHELQKAGIEMDNSLCEHFRYSRQDLLHIVKTKGLRTFDEVLAAVRQRRRLRGVQNPDRLHFRLHLERLHSRPRTLQDTNDRFLGNIQRNGTYSVIPRSPGGELTPQQLIVMGQVAEEFNLYTKLTGSQRVALFGVHLADLPRSGKNWAPWDSNPATPTPKDCAW